MDRILLLPEFRHVKEEYEPELWCHMMRNLEPGDVVADVGAFIGLYTIAAAQRVGSMGRVLAFEPDPINFSILQRHVSLNEVRGRVHLSRAAITMYDGMVGFESGRGCQSQIRDTGGLRTPCARLDAICGGRKIDVLKIDVEGYEQMVLEGGTQLLLDPGRRPRHIYIEVHPFAWSSVGSSSESLLSVLWSCGYELRTLSGQVVERLASWEHLVASPRMEREAGEGCRGAQRLA
jgi:FkbM family methyltransferase